MEVMFEVMDRANGDTGKLWALQALAKFQGFIRELGAAEVTGLGYNSE